MLWIFLGTLRDSNLEINNATGVSVGVLILLVVLFFVFKKIGFSKIGNFFLGKCKFLIARYFSSWCNCFSNIFCDEYTSCYWF